GTSLGILLASGLTVGGMLWYAASQRPVATASVPDVAPKPEVNATPAVQRPLADEKEEARHPPETTPPLRGQNPRQLDVPPRPQRKRVGRPQQGVGSDSRRSTFKR